MIIDIIVAIILLLSALIAFLRGFIREVLTIFGTVGALIAAYYAGPHLTPAFEGWLGVTPDNNPKLFDIVPYAIIAKALAYGSVFIVVIVALSLLSHLVAESAKKIGLGAIDRTLGVFFGLIRGILLLGLLYLPLHLMAAEETKERWFEGSKTHFYMEATADWITKFLPNHLIGDHMETRHETRDKLKDMELLKTPEKAIENIQNQTKDGIKTEQLLEYKNGKMVPAQEGYSEGFRDQMDKLFEDTNITPETKESAE